MISNELSNAFFGFSLRCLGAELEGGGGGHKSPHQVVENPEAHQGAGYNVYFVTHQILQPMTGACVQLNIARRRTTLP